MDHVAEVWLGVEEDEVALEGGPDLVLGRVQASDDRGHGVGEPGPLETLVVVVGVGEEGPQGPRSQQVAAGEVDARALE